MKILILGGGFCGTAAAKLLEKKIPKAEITLIDKKSYFEFSPSIHKVAFDKKYFKKITIPYKNIFKRTKFIQDKIIEVSPYFVKTSKRIFSFDYLIICTGIKYPINLKNTKNVCPLKDFFEAAEMGVKIASSKRILVIGGGLIGTEIAGELVTRTNIEVILVHSSNRLLDRNPAKASKYAYDFLTKRGVKIIFNEKIVLHSDGYFITNTKRKIKAQVGLWCAGILPDASFMKEFGNLTDSKGFIKVNEFLQLEKHKRIFVGGDINNVPEEKTAQNAERHAYVIAKNIITLVKNSSTHKQPITYHKLLVFHNPRSGPLVISLGDWHGILSFKNFAWCGRIPGILKHLIEWWVVEWKYS
ncbi:MAG: FAD-dependent oxidoreductase [Nanoarchaeota archaeon]